MKLLSLFVCMVGFIGSSAAQDAPTIGCPTHEVGKKITYQVTEGSSKKSTEEAVTKIENNLIFTSEGNVYDFMMNMVDVKGVKYSPKYYNQPECPFRLGEIKRDIPVSWTVRGNATQAGVTVSVAESLTTVTTTYGTFTDVVKIVSSGAYTSGRFSGMLERVSYYSPKLGLPVLVEYESRSSSGTRKVKLELDTK